MVRTPRKSRLISLREYARRRGIDESAVRKAARQGRITLIDGKVDAVKADKEWSARTLPRVGQRARAARKVPKGGPAVGQSGGDEELEAAAPGGNTYLAARTRREAAAAEAAELDLQLRKGTLVNADQARERVFKAARAARDLVLGLPERLAPRLIGQGDEAIRRPIDRRAGANRPCPTR